MGRWLRLAGIIPEATPKQKAPDNSELRNAWEECRHKISVIAKRYGVGTPVIKRWLKEAGIIIEDATGIRTVAGEMGQENNPALAGETQEVICPSRIYGGCPRTPAADELRHTWEEADHVLETVAGKYEVTPALAGRWLKEAGIIDEQTGLAETQRKGDAPGDLPDEHDHEVIKRIVDFCVVPLQGRIEKLEVSVASLAQVILANNKNDGDILYGELLDILADLLVRIVRKVTPCPDMKS